MSDTFKVVRVRGLPAPQGSKRHVGHGVMVESSKAVAPWREAVVAACIEQGIADLHMLGAIEVRIDFLMPRPKSHYLSKGLRTDAPFLVSRKPDIDKLARSTLDAITQAGVIADDAQIAVLSAVKHYSEHTPGAWIRIEPATDNRPTTGEADD